MRIEINQKEIDEAVKNYLSKRGYEIADEEVTFEDDEENYLENLTATITIKK